MNERDAARKRDSAKKQDSANERDARDGRARRGIRVRTLVFGLAVAAVAVSVLVSLLSDVAVDGTVVTFSLLIGAGLALVAGGVASAVRENRHGADAEARGAL